MTVISKIVRLKPVVIGLKITLDHCRCSAAVITGAEVILFVVDRLPALISPAVRTEVEPVVDAPFVNTGLPAACSVLAVAVKVVERTVFISKPAICHYRIRILIVLGNINETGIIITYIFIKVIPCPADLFPPGISFTVGADITPELFADILSHDFCIIGVCCHVFFSLTG